MKMKQLLVTASMLLVSSLVFAGATNAVPVTVTLNEDGSGDALGDMVTARFSESTVELIGCGVRSFSDGVGGVIEFGFCQARMEDGSEEGLRGFCNTTNAGLLDAMKTTSNFAFVTFRWDANGECTNLGFSTQSVYIPKALKSK